MTQLTNEVQLLLALIPPQVIFVLAFIGITWIGSLVYRIASVVKFYAYYDELPSSPERMEINALKAKIKSLEQEKTQLVADRDQAQEELKDAFGKILADLSGQ